jgi:hypothetical protein
MFASKLLTSLFALAFRVEWEKSRAAMARRGAAIKAVKIGFLNPNFFLIQRQVFNIADRILAYQTV